MPDTSESPRQKRDDVGYKRPPAEHQFRKGEKPPPRKRKVEQDFDAEGMFWRVLQEPRRVTIGGKLKWVTTAELLARKAFHSAEKGSSTLQRLLNQLMLGGKGSPDEPLFVIEPDEP